MRLARPGLVAALAVTALSALVAPSANAAAVGSCTASVSISTHSTGELTASITASIDGDCSIGHRDEISCEVTLFGPLGVVAVSSGYGIATEGCYTPPATMNGVAPGVYTAVGQVSYVTYTPGVDTAVAVA